LVGEGERAALHHLGYGLWIIISPDKSHQPFDGRVRGKILLYNVALWATEMLLPWEAMALDLMALLMRRSLFLFPMGL
jgi:hypothetical protein